MSENPIDVPASVDPREVQAGTVKGENSRANVQNVRGDSSAEFSHGTGFHPSPVVARSQARPFETHTSPD